MRARLHQLWQALHRERGPRRQVRKGRRSRAGVALLLVTTIIALMSVLVIDLVRNASIRINLAANQRDEIVAEALAQSGVQFYRLVLIASKQIGERAGPFLAGLGFPVNADTLWQIIPTVDSGMMRILLLADDDEDEAAELQRTGLTKEQREQTEGYQGSLKKAFLDFKGDFTATVTDENRRIYVGRFQATNMVELQSNPQAGLLSSLMSGENQDKYLREHNLDRWELIANLADWTDGDNQRIYNGGNEDSVYQRLDDNEVPYLPKNSPFDTLEEIRLVDGWERDAVWFRFGRHLTTYGNGKVNVNTADRKVMEAILKRFIQPVPTDDSLALIFKAIQDYRNTPILMEGGGGVFRDVGQFVSLLRAVSPGSVDEGIGQVVTTSSTVFRVTSKGTMGDATVSVEVVFDFSRQAIGKVVYWGVK